MRSSLPVARLISLAAFICALAAGCAEHSQQAPALKLPPARPQRVDFANLSAHTSAVDASASVNADELLARVAAIQKREGSDARLHRLVQRFPDAALEILRNATAAQASQPQWMAVAMAYDRSFIALNSAGWTKGFMDAGVRPEEYESIRRNKLLSLHLIETGHPEKVLTEAMPSNSSTFAFAEADLLRLHGIAALLCDKPADALRDWGAAAELARADRAVCAELYLLEAEALRHNGTEADSMGRWSAAAISGISVHDPGFWQRLLEARNECAQWPPEVAAYFDPSARPSTAAVASSASSATARVEARIWRQIGEWRFARGETPAALLAFKQSEALFVIPHEKLESRIDEARALLAMNQAGAATSILTSLTTDPDAQVSHHAMAVLANARIAIDDVPGALTLLQAAVANDDSFPVAQRAPARADLGLVYLMSSREADGLNWLHRAQADFAACHDNGGLVQCLQNEAAYFEQKDKADQAKALRERAARLSAVY